MIAVINYGAGNLFSICASLKALGADVKITDRKEDIIAADRIVLPGVGAFEDAIEKLRKTGLVDTIISETEKGKYLLGICLGMQLLFEKSYEYGEHEGLGIIKGNIRLISDDFTDEQRKALKIPHIGWNALSLMPRKRHRCSSCESAPGCSKMTKPDKIFDGINDGDCVYFVHSYYGTDCEESTIAKCEYGIPVTAAVRSGSVYGTQFHPEKSGKTGMRILKNFIEL